MSSDSSAHTDHYHNLEINHVIIMKLAFPVNVTINVNIMNSGPHGGWGADAKTRWGKNTILCLYILGEGAALVDVI
jgi:hypothetical protein